MIEQPDLRPVQERGNIYVLQSDYCCKGFTVPAGYRCDGASIPRFAWTMTGLLPDGLHRAAALVHDYLYSEGGSTIRYGAPFTYSRRQADKIFREILTELHLIKWHIAVLYIGVRLGGFLHWRSK